MTVLRDISYLWSILHMVALFFILFEPRYSQRVTLLAGFLGTSALLIVNVGAMLWMGHGIIMGISFFTCTIPSLLIGFALSRYRDGRLFFLFCLTDTICFWLMQITNFLDRLAGGGYVVLLVTRLLVFPVVEIFFWRNFRQPYMELQRKLNSGTWWLFTAVGGTYYLLIMFTSVPVDTPMPGPAGIARILLVLLLMPLTYLTILRSLWRQMQVNESTRQMELQRQEYSAICRKVEIGRIYRHDMRHHLVILEEMLQKGDMDSARQYVRQLSGKIASLSQDAWCANSAVNAVLTAYIAQAEESGCPVKASVRIPEELPCEEMDLCIMLANTLENAIHACRESVREDRHIALSLELTENQRLLLSISNDCPRPVELDRDGMPLPPRKEGHGLGLQSVRSVADKYDGLLRCRWEEERFTLQAVLFPSPNGGGRQRKG